MAQNSTTSSIFRLLRSFERTTLFLLIAVNLAVPLLLAASKWPKPWRGLDGEESPINWFSSVQCLLVAAAALAVFLASRAVSAQRSDARSHWPWLLFAGGFTFMALDEQFQGHERIREEILRPNGIMTDISFLIPGDIVLVGYVVIGVICAAFILSELKQHPLSLKLFVVAVTLIGFAAVQDALDFPWMHSPTVRHVQTVVEELAEIWAQLLFALSFLVILSHKLHWIIDHGDELRESPEISDG